jgi:hypothetical protein
LFPINYNSSEVCEQNRTRGAYIVSNSTLMTMMLEMIVPRTVILSCTDHLLSTILDIRKLMDLKLIILLIKCTKALKSQHRTVFGHSESPDICSGPSADRSSVLIGIIYTYRPICACVRVYIQ